MKRIIISIGFTILYSAHAFAIDPIPGSITYENKSGYTTKAPVGSTTSHKFTNGGSYYTEWYIVGADHRLKLVSRQNRSN